MKWNGMEQNGLSVGWLGSRVDEQTDEVREWVDAWSGGWIDRIIDGQLISDSQTN